MQRELSAIRLSAYANAFFGVLGTAAGIRLHSDAILLDGVFNWISFGMALLSLKVARLLPQPGSDSFPFGYAAFEPAINTVKAMLLIGVGLFALFGAIDVIQLGGRPLAAGWAVGYAAIAVAGCFGVAWYQFRTARSVDSPLVSVDARNWLVNGAVSSAVGIAFLAALLLGDAPVVPYVDSLLVIILVVVTTPVPARMAIDGIGELLASRPPDEVHRAISDRFGEAIAGEAGRFELRMNRLGRTVVLLADAYVDPARPVGDLERVRASLHRRMEESFPHILMAVVFRPEGR